MYEAIHFLQEALSSFEMLNDHVCDIDQSLKVMEQTASDRNGNDSESDTGRQTDRQTDRQKDQNTQLPFYSEF